MAQTSVGHVFISYSRKDEAVIKRIAKLLRRRGVDIWVDNKELVPGTPIWEEEIEKAIRGASAIVVLLSPDSKNSEWVRREIAFAEQYDKRIFPVLVRGDAKESIPIRLITSQFVDIRQNEDAGLRILCTELTRFLKDLEVQEEADFTEATNIERKQKRILEAAIENVVTVGNAAQLFVLIRRLDSKGIISIIQSVDEEIILDENNLKAKELEIEFPVEHGRIGFASISLQLTSPNFSPPQQSKHIKIPSDGDSELITFIVVPRAAGRLILQLEVLSEATSLTSRTIRTTAVESDETRQAKLLYSVPIVILVQHLNELKAPEELEQKERMNFASWAARHRVLATALVGTFIIILALAIWFATGVIKNSQKIIPVATTATSPAALQPASDLLTPNCRPSGNQPPSIHLNLVPRSVKINLTAELTISVSDPENDAYEILLFTAEKGEFPNGKEEPYLYIAPGLPDQDIITVWVGDHECQTKEEITITITQ